MHCQAPDPTAGSQPARCKHPNLKHHQSPRHQPKTHDAPPNHSTHTGVHTLLSPPPKKQHTFCTPSCLIAFLIALQASNDVHVLGLSTSSTALLNTPVGFVGVVVVVHVSVRECVCLFVFGGRGVKGGEGGAC